MQKITILKGNIVFTAVAEKFEVYADSFIVSVDGYIKGIFKTLPETYQNEQVIDHGNRLIIPGFVDLHLHAAQFPQCGVGMTHQLLQWLEDYTFDLEREYQNPEFAEKVYTAFVDKLVAYGTLRSCMFASSSTQGTEILFEILKKKGLGALVGKVNMDTNAPDFIIESTAGSLKGTEYLINKYKDEPLVRPVITPRFAPTSTSQLLKGLGDLAIKYGLPVQSHVSENPDEIAWVKALFNDAKNYSDVYHQNQLFGQTPTVMAHAIHLEKEEIELALKNNVFLIHCPDSNINVRSGIMPIRQYLNMGLKIGLGSDIAGGHKIGMNEAVVRAIQLSKLYSLEHPDDKPISISEGVYLGTKGGGEFFGKTGSFENGYALDALVIEDDEFTSERYSLEDRLERFIYIGDDRNIIARYVEGNAI
ncbi:amidohydrolase family protein [Psychromonas sp. KJ10-10]|uniref:amidohydrolase family protein n=1 Tax=Psychromonas sp. KJ10-10 TaxID=3391823 RepID=UPI0039B597FC